MNARLACTVLVALALLPDTARGQQNRLDGRVDARTRAAVERLADSARAAGLPVQPLIDKTLEGTMKGAEPARILGAVRALAGRLASARAALGTDVADAELVAAAGALSVGVSPGALVRLRDATAVGSAATPFVVLADLVSRGVPADTASAALLALASRGADADAYLALRGDVARAIAAGAPPAVATSVRAAGGLVSSPSPALTNAPGGTRALSSDTFNEHAPPPRPKP